VTHFADGGFAASGLVSGFTLSSPGKLSRSWLAGAWPRMRAAHYCSRSRFRPSSQGVGTTMPSADFYRPIRIDHSLLSLDFETNGRSPEVSSTAFRTQPPNLQPVPLMDMGFAIISPLARHRMPQIRFLYIGSYVCSTLLSDLASRRRRCASLSLHLHQVV